MLKCPYCAYENEEGTLFCEQCKSDLAVISQADIPSAQPMEAAAEPLVQAAAAVASTAQHAPLSEAIADTVTHEPVAAAPGSAPAASEPTLAAAPGDGVGPPLPEGAQPRLVVLRGLRLNVEYPIYEGENYIGRTDEKPVDIDLEDQEPPDRIWSSRQHAVLHLFEGLLSIEDLNSSNGTFVNRTRVYPNQRRGLQPGDVLQIGTVQLKVKV